MTETINAAENIRQTLSSLICALVDHPDKIQINMMVGEQATVYEVRCAKTDRGKIIGKAGKTAACLRYFLVCMASRVRIRATMEIVD